MNINKIKEWILVSYTKKDILELFDNKIKKIDDSLLFVSVMEYYKSFNHSYEWQIIDEIIKSVDNEFTIDIDDMKKITFFVEKYIMIIIPEFGNYKKKDVYLYYENKK